MLDVALRIVTDFFAVLVLMSPYLLLGFLAAGLMAALLPRGFIERHLGGGGYWPVVKAAALGVPLPLCSCSVIPVAASLRKHGASRSATMGFLIATPETGIDSILVTYGMLGWVFAAFRAGLAVAGGLLGGLLVLIFGGREEARAPVPAAPAGAGAGGIVARLRYALRYGFVDLPRDIAKTMVIGLAIAALISALVPPRYFANVLPPGIGQIAVMMLAGIPIYVCATASVPIAAALMMAGVSPGAALAFLVTGPATNAATIAMIYKVLGRRVAFLYILTIAITAMGGGLLLDQILQTSGQSMMHEHGEMLPMWFQLATTVLLLAMLGWGMISPLINRRKAAAATCCSGEGEAMRQVQLQITGMTCQGCARNVHRTLLGCAGVKAASVNLADATATLDGTDFDLAAVRQALKDEGFDVTAHDDDAKTR